MPKVFACENDLAKLFPVKLLKIGENWKQKSFNMILNNKMLLKKLFRSLFYGFSDKNFNHQCAGKRNCCHWICVWLPWLVVYQVFSWFSPLSFFSNWKWVEKVRRSRRERSRHQMQQLRKRRRMERETVPRKRAKRRWGFGGEKCLNRSQGTFNWRGKKEKPEKLGSFRAIFSAKRQWRMLIMFVIIWWMF